MLEVLVIKYYYNNLRETLQESHLHHSTFYIIFEIIRKSFSYELDFYCEDQYLT